MPRNRVNTMNMAKRASSLFLMGALAVSLIACADTAPGNQSEGNQSGPKIASADLWPHPMDCAGGVPFTLDGYDPVDPMIYIDAPDSDAVRATAPLEAAWLAQLARGEILPPVVKRYCQMGATQMVVEMTHPVEDDAVSAVTLRAIYRWVADDAGVGWQIAAVGTQQQCARGRTEDGGLCA